MRTATKKLCMIAAGIAVNAVCTFVGLALKLPIYLDSIGTIFISITLGPQYGILTGVAGALISSTFDIYSLYYCPVQILTATMAWLMRRAGWLSGGRMPLGGFAVCLPTALASAAITAAVFGGITSAGSSYLVALFHTAGMNLTLSCFVVQIITEYADKLIACVIADAAVHAGAGRGLH